MIEKYRVHEVSKDLNIPSKDLITLVEENFPGEPKKHMTALTDDELNLIFETFTQKNNMESLDEYFALKSRPKPKAEKPPQKTPSQLPPRTALWRACAWAFKAAWRQA